MSELRLRNASVAIRIHAASLSLQAFHRCHLKPTTLSHTLKGRLCLDLVQHAVLVCIQPIKQGGSGRLYLGKLECSITVAIHLAKSLASSLPVRGTSVAGREDDELDRLVFEATIEPTGEQVLARKVMSEIAQPKRRTLGPTLDLGSWSMPAVAAGIALVLTASAAGGYIAAGVKAEITDNALLAFAVGVPPSGIAETLGLTRNNGGRP